MRSAQILVVAWMAGAATAACSEDSPTPAAPPVASVDARGNAAWHAQPGMGLTASGDVAVPGGFFVEPLARGAFPDRVDVTFRIKLDRATRTGRDRGERERVGEGEGRTNVVHVRDASDALLARIIFQPGGSVGWHTHPGPVIVTVLAGELSIINASDCVLREYAAGKAFVDPGQGNVHVGFNATDGETIVFAQFLDVPAGQPATIPADDPGCIS
jgi:hypothetical protein